MVAAANSKILVRIKKQHHINRCSIYGKKLNFARTTENPLSCWQCMIVMWIAESKGNTKGGSVVFGKEGQKKKIKEHTAAER